TILRMMLSRGFGLVLVGIGAGVVVALGLARFLTNMLFGVQPSDPITFGGVALLLVSISMVACYVPARRATRVDPLVALRYE
ncbi:MAG TPA: FtsX-like permease family protein, partial [Candidatus Binatia bacterium]|nr:FtsX-like permease family protein [Candidatus Binatia bacterium]